jgi:hypothetical protein
VSASGHPWAIHDPVWYAALESGGLVYNVARMVTHDGRTRFERLDRASGEWQPAREGAAYFTEIGGTTDAVPVSVIVGERLVELLRERPGEGVPLAAALQVAGSKRQPPGPRRRQARETK